MGEEEATPAVEEQRAFLVAKFVRLVDRTVPGKPSEERIARVRRNLATSPFATNDD